MKTESFCSASIARDVLSEISRCIDGSIVSLTRNKISVKTSEGAHREVECLTNNNLYWTLRLYEQYEIE